MAPSSMGAGIFDQSTIKGSIIGLRSHLDLMRLNCHHQSWAPVSMIRLLLVPVILLSLGQAAAATESAEKLQRLRDVMTERLVIMEDIARYKWNAGLPVEDRDREALVLERTLAMAVGRGIEARTATRFLRAQIEAAKIVQRALFGQWRKSGRGKFAKAPDLTATLRPQIDRLSRQLIAALATAQNDLDDCIARRILSPVPEALARFPRAWGLAVEGALGDTGPCRS